MLYHETNRRIISYINILLPQFIDRDCYVFPNIPNKFK